MKNIANFLRDPLEFFQDKHNQRLLILSIFIILFFCLLILLTKSARGEEQAIYTDDVTGTSVFKRPTITATKWWIKMTATSSPIPSGFTTAIYPAVSTDGCPPHLSSALKADIYAYISLTPPLPNRIRSRASLSADYLGQIDPGNGLKLISGPICADGYSWWLVESLHSGLRGWTVEGRSSEQWLVPCPNEHEACSQTANPMSSGVVSKNENNIDEKEDVCKSTKLAAGMLAQVGQDSLLVVRLEPDIGEVIGRAGPTSRVRIIDGPTCAGNTVWWKVNVLDLNLVGWATETDLYACPKDSVCTLGSPD